jgi:hypothetical protein
VPKPDHIVHLEPRQQALDDNIAQALLHCSTDDLMVVDLKRRALHLRDELERLRHEAAADSRLH